MLAARPTRSANGRKAESRQKIKSLTLSKVKPNQIGKSVVYKRQKKL